MAGGPKPVLPLSSVAVHLTGNSTFGALVVAPAASEQAVITLEGTQGFAKLELSEGATPF